MIIIGESRGQKQYRRLSHLRRARLPTQPSVSEHHLLTAANEKA
jgi:hypothetical protein